MKLSTYYGILKNMGPQYVSYRSMYELKKRIGILKAGFPIHPPKRKYISLEQWRKSAPAFFFSTKDSIALQKDRSQLLKQEYEQYLHGNIKFFNSTYIKIYPKYDWITNPITKYRYDISSHWTELEDLSKEAGDIKYVWEKSRFSFIHTLIRYDYHFEEDCAKFVFDEIEDWMIKNPINQGPNYVCSQEISLRLMNWTYALYYFKNSAFLTEEFFDQIQHSMYWQTHHVYKNINFSRKTVRNNHAITEVFLLYFMGLLFPYFPDSGKWKSLGKKWFEAEIEYQIYEDGTYLQHSHNYHRVVIQLLTWSFYLSELHHEKFSPTAYKRAFKSLGFLYQCMNDTTGELPNYGANDGALFFKMNNASYNDFRPQLNALYFYFKGEHFFEDSQIQEDVFWLGNIATPDHTTYKDIELTKKNVLKYDSGGYYLFRNSDAFTFIRCNDYRDRPSHADNLHVDIWYKNINLLRDPGTFRYNDSEKMTRFFNSTSSHNTITLGHHDQMLKGPRFIWLKWSHKVVAEVNEENESVLFYGKIVAFKHIGKNITHTRKVRIFKNEIRWLIEDEVDHGTNLPIIQHWNISPEFSKWFTIMAMDEDQKTIEPTMRSGYFSKKYGIKEESKIISFSSESKKIITVIKGR